MARAGVSYTVGREGRGEYGESLAGRKEIQPGNHQFVAPVSPYDDEGNLLPYLVRDEDLGEVGSADRKVQAYCFRLCLTDVEENRIPIARPEGYDPARAVATLHPEPLGLQGASQPARDLAHPEREDRPQQRAGGVDQPDRGQLGVSRGELRAP
jgi:hypothetical protein